MKKKIKTILTDGTAQDFRTIRIAIFIAILYLSANLIMISFFGQKFFLFRSRHLKADILFIIDNYRLFLVLIWLSLRAWIIQNKKIQKQQRFWFIVKYELRFLLYLCLRLSRFCQRYTVIGGRRDKDAAHNLKELRSSYLICVFHSKCLGVSNKAKKNKKVMRLCYMVENVIELNCFIHGSS